MRFQFHFLSPLVFCLFLAACQTPAAVLVPAQESPKVEMEEVPELGSKLDLRQIHASGEFSGEFFRGGRWADEGPIIQSIERGDDGQSLLVSFNLETEEKSVVLDGSNLVAGDVDRAINIEGYKFSADKSKVLLYTDSERVWRRNTKGYYYVYDIASGEVASLDDREKGFQMFAKMSPDGDKVAFVRNRNLFVRDLGSGIMTQLTFDGSDGKIINGTSDWVYEEEFGIRDAWLWSPDGSYIAFYQFDETETRNYQLPDLRGFYPEFTEFRYPKAGETNSEIRIGVVDMSNNELSFFETGTWKDGDQYEYIAGLGWTSDAKESSKVWMIRLNRDQNDVDLIFGDPQNMESKVILNEKSNTWIDVETGFSDLDTGKVNFLADGENFVWISEKDGYRHLYLHDYTGREIRQLTQGEWDVTQFHGIADQKVYFSSTFESPMERHLYSWPWLSDNTVGPTRISTSPGWHSINMSPDKSYYIDSFSDSQTPSRTELLKSDGSSVRMIRGNFDLINKLRDLDLPRMEFSTIKGADGTELNAYVIKPSDFDTSKKYPVQMFVYGGPGSQQVRNAWGGSRYLWHAYLADELDIIIACVDNRGTGGRGKAFKSVPYKKIGAPEALDQIAAAKNLGRLSYVDSTRIGIWGWSYGGTMTLMSMLSGDGPNTFKLGMAVAPVTHWGQYDTVYTERYMSQPQTNMEGYDLGSPLSYIDKMADHQKLLVVHGDMDDNVHFQNTVQLIDALQIANKQFDLMIYPGKNHGIFGGLTRLNLHTKMTNYLADNL